MLGKTGKIVLATSIFLMALAGLSWNYLSSGTPGELSKVRTVHADDAEDLQSVEGSATFESLNVSSFYLYDGQRINCERAGVSGEDPYCYRNGTLYWREINYTVEGDLDSVAGTLDEEVIYTYENGSNEVLMRGEEEVDRATEISQVTIYGDKIAYFRKKIMESPFETEESLIKGNRRFEIDQYPRLFGLENGLAVIVERNGSDVVKVDGEVIGRFEEAYSVENDTGYLEIFGEKNDTNRLLYYGGTLPEVKGSIHDIRKVNNSSYILAINQEILNLYRNGDLMATDIDLPQEVNNRLYYVKRFENTSTVFVDGEVYREYETIDTKVYPTKFGGEVAIVRGSRGSWQVIQNGEQVTRNFTAIFPAEGGLLEAENRNYTLFHGDNSFGPYSILRDFGERDGKLWFRAIHRNGTYVLRSEGETRFFDGRGAFRWAKSELEEEKNLLERLKNRYQPRKGSYDGEMLSFRGEHYEIYSSDLVYHRGLPVFVEERDMFEKGETGFYWGDERMLESYSEFSGPVKVTEGFAVLASNGSKHTLFTGG